MQVDGAGRIVAAGVSGRFALVSRHLTGGTPDPAYAGAGATFTAVDAAAALNGLALEGERALLGGTAGPAAGGGSLLLGATQPGGAADPAFGGADAGIAPPGWRYVTDGGTFTSAEALASGPNGTTYSAGTAQGNRGFIARTLPNAAPTPTLAAPARTAPGAAVTLDATASSDPEGEPLRFAFDLDGDGAFELDAGATPAATRSFAAAGTYTVGVRVTDPRGASAAATRTIAVDAPIPPEPVLGKRGVARTLRGVVRVRLPGRRKFVRLDGLTAIPNGTEIDARRGRVLLTVVRNNRGKLDSAEFYAGRFVFRQAKGRRPVTSLKLTGGSFRSCRARAAAAVATAAIAADRGNKKKKKVRRLWGDGHGRFRTRGRYGAATVRGTKWLTQDRCDGTLVRVARGRVRVEGIGVPSPAPDQGGGEPGGRSGERRDREGGSAEARARRALTMIRALRVRLLAVVALLAAAVACTIQATSALDRLELDSVDTRFEIRGEQPAPRDLVVVAIDDKTFDELGEQFPFSRNRFARVLEQVDAAGPELIVYDVQFTEPSDDPRADNRLIEASRAAGNVVFSTTEVGDHGESNVFGGADALEFARATAGNGLLPEDPGGFLRRVPVQVDGLDTLAVAALERLGQRVPRDRMGGDGAWIDYRGPGGHLARVSFSDVAQGEIPRERLAGTDRRDRRDGALAPGQPPGVVARLDACRARRSTPRRSTRCCAARRCRRRATGVDLALAIGLALLAPLLALVLRPWTGLVAALAAAVAYAVAAQLLFDGGWIVPVVAPLAGLAVGFVGTVLVHWLTAAFERARTRDVFARFVPDSVVDQVLARAGEDGDPRLGGERMDATVLFSDLRGFTTFAEARDPEQVIEVLNRYLTAMSDAILDHDGTLVAYMGDGIMAVFGAPVAAPDHADRALAAARAMLARLEEFNAWVRERGVGDGFTMGIGLHSGPVMSGNVGSARRLEYAAIGDTTNTAARLEGMTKGTRYQLFVSEPTRDRLRQAPGELEFVSELEVRGREHAIRVWGVPG